MLNKVLLIGRLTKDPEVRFLPSGTQVSTFTMVVNRKYKSKSGEWQEETYFFDIETYGNLAERVGKQFSKGYQIYLEGSLRQDKWETQAGEKRSKIKIVADKISLLSKPGEQKNSSIKEEDLSIPTEDLESDDEIPF